MSQVCNCDIETVEMPLFEAKIEFPKNMLPVPIVPEPTANIWQSDWFTIQASSTFDFNHNLNLEKPWLCMPRVVGRMLADSGGWSAGEIIFCDGDNYLGCIEGVDMGWVISIDSNTAHISFGNSESYFGIPKDGGGNENMAPKTGMECKLVISY